LKKRQKCKKIKIEQMTIKQSSIAANIY